MGSGVSLVSGWQVLSLWLLVVIFLGAFFWYEDKVTEVDSILMAFFTFALLFTVSASAISCIWLYQNTKHLF